MHGPFTDQVAVVTGASSGIGKAIASALGAQGATLCVLGRNVGPLRITAPRVAKYAVDLAEETQIGDVPANIQKDFGGVDILVHSAGVFVQDRVDAATLADFDLQYRVNVRAPYLLTQALLPALRVRRGQIVFLNSSVAGNARATISQYAATKAALKAFADSLRDEVNTDGVRVLSVFVGQTATPMQASIYKSQGREYRPERLLQPEDVASVIVDALKLPRTAEVTDISIRPMLKASST
jgi:NADP-dependent 3-hydroxy acid dehydrogenase YdfG